MSPVVVASVVAPDLYDGDGGGWRLGDKAVYGLKQAPRAWYATLTNFKVGSHLMLVQIYADDIILGSTDPNLLNYFKNMMKSQFELSMMGKVNNFLGLYIRQSRECIFINQENYSRNLLVNFGMMNNTKLLVPMAVGTRLGPSFYNPAVDLTLYMSMISSLLYLTASRPDIMFAACNCARYKLNPREPHLTAVKNIFRYLKGTVSLGLLHPSKTGFFIQAFSDVDLGGCQLDRKSRSGGSQLLDEKLVSWQSKRLTCVSISIAEAEYVVAVACTSQIIWIQIQLRDYVINMKKISLYCD
ncbi:uncharacterized mitochondrial protein AtMg00810-like [Lactuca sativa]|uniref:uncharacterized mitochondrial protein AtMg00810-like n=1 Tax=Lactuca sativa TaxID=4236 RepID=UPI000CD91111|nr:uncharacterized mitochondrial protein AtMg00810-like [Lactuca sativa]